MRSWLPHIADGLVTGCFLAGAIAAGFLLLGSDLPSAGEWIFLSGAALAVLSGVWTIVGYRRTPGLIGLLRGEAEVYPSAGDKGIWIDRFVNPRNVWLVAGFTMIVASYLPPFLGT
jgi:hypothetical protein